MGSSMRHHISGIARIARYSAFMVRSESLVLSFSLAWFIPLRQIIEGLERNGEATQEAFLFQVST